MLPLLRSSTLAASPFLSGNSIYGFSTSKSMSKKRNFGISAHIDSGKTTLTERLLFYSGRINSIHEVRGKDGVGATMDSMDLEREKGITIQSAATFANWNDHDFNVIDTPGHVDFTIEVERALRVLDGAIMIVCASSGVQSQTLTVDRQMKRYGVPRIAFINKCDRLGANPFGVIEQIKDNLGLNAVALHIPIGLESSLAGVVDLMSMRALYFEGENGENIIEKEIPANLIDKATEKRADMLDSIAALDEEFAEEYIMEEDAVSIESLKKSIRKSTLDQTLVPVMMGSAFKNKGVQPLLNGICDFLPAPDEVSNQAIDFADKEEEKQLTLTSSSEDPLVALAFKLEQSRFGQLTYMRVYQGTLKKGTSIFNTATKQMVKVPRVIRMHADQMEDVDSVGAGEICALFGVDCASGETFTASGDNLISMTSMFVPDPVMSLSIAPKNRGDQANFSKALSRFTREDPTLRVSTQDNEFVIQGMGELHLEVYRERLLREYNCETITGPPTVSYRESPCNETPFEYQHKKQSGGRGQYAKVIGKIEVLEDPRDPDGIELAGGEKYEFFNGLVGNNIPPQFVPACEKGFANSVTKGPLLGKPVSNVRVTLTDGEHHPVDSSELAFSIACERAFTEALKSSDPAILEPIMKVEVTGDREFQQAMTGLINKRSGLVSDQTFNGNDVTIRAETPLANMFGFSTALRSSTQGKAEFSMEYLSHRPVPRDVQERLIKQHAEEKNT